MTRPVLIPLPVPAATTARATRARRAALVAVASLVLCTPLAAAPRDCTEFARGARALVGTAGVSHDPGIGSVAVSNLGVEWQVRDCLGAFVGLNTGYDMPRRQPDGWQVGPAAGLRWQWRTGPGWSVYLDGQAAPVRHQHALSEHSLRFNFDLQGGAGASRALTPDTRLLGGLRWHHLSNARVRGQDRNLGYDGALLYGGLARRF